MLKKEIGQVVDWSQVDKEDYLLRMEEVRLRILKSNSFKKCQLTDMIDDRTVYMKGIDASYYYEGYNVFKTDELS